jgi:hypothetical protein
VNVETTAASTRRRDCGSRRVCCRAQAGTLLDSFAAVSRRSHTAGPSLYQARSPLPVAGAAGASSGVAMLPTTATTSTPPRARRPRSRSDEAGGARELVDSDARPRPRLQRVPSEVASQSTTESEALLGARRLVKGGVAAAAVDGAISWGAELPRSAGADAEVPRNAGGVGGEVPRVRRRPQSAGASLGASSPAPATRVAVPSRPSGTAAARPPAPAARSRPSSSKSRTQA